MTLSRRTFSRFAVALGVAFVLLAGLVPQNSGLGVGTATPAEAQTIVRSSYSSWMTQSFSGIKCRWRHGYIVYSSGTKRANTQVDRNNSNSRCFAHVSPGGSTTSGNLGCYHTVGRYWGTGNVNEGEGQYSRSRFWLDGAGPWGSCRTRHFVSDGGNTARISPMYTRSWS